MTSLPERIAQINSGLPSNLRGAITAESLRELLISLTTSEGATSIDPYNLASLSDTDDCTSQLQALLDDCFGTGSSPHGAGNAHLNKPFILPPGRFNISSPLTVRSVRGGSIKGAGRFNTQIINQSGGPVFVTNGFEYSSVEGMYLQSVGTTGVIFDCDWDGTGSTSLQSNTFYDMFFQDGGTGIRIGNTGYQGSEMLFVDCFWSVQARAGMYIGNFNALQMTVIGGNFQTCGVGIWVGFGSCPVIQGVGFQGQSNWDIRIDNTANDVYCISGCRSESPNFIFSPSSAAVNISGCSQIHATNGTFALVHGPFIVDACQSTNGALISQGPGLHLRGNQFGRADYLDYPLTHNVPVVEGHVGGIKIHSAIDNRIATASGTQSSSQLLTNSINRFTTVTTTGDGAKLPVSVQGMSVTVINVASNSMNVFPNTGETINSLSVNDPFALAGGKSAIFFCAAAGQWTTFLSA